jgi:accessory gene regulator protein AgrB
MCMDNMVPYYVVMCLLHAYNKRENTYFLKVRFGLEFVYSVLFTLPKIP